MTPQIAPPRPWRPDESRRAIRGQVVVRTRDERDHVPHRADVTAGAATAATRLDDHAIDRVLARSSPGVRVTRVYHAAQSVSAIGQRHRGFGSDEIELGLSRTFQIEIAPDAAIVRVVDRLRDLDAVEMATPVYVEQCPFAAEPPASPRHHRGDPRWGHRMIRSAEALDREPGDPAVIVAIVDSGVAAAIPELRGRCRTGMDLVDLRAADLSRDLHLLGDIAGREHDTSDDMGHGTACASVIAARGLAMPAGVAGYAPVLPLRVLAAAMVAGRDAPTAIGSLPDIDSGVKFAVDLGARVLNLSFGTPHSALADGDPVPHAEIAQYAMRRGCVLVAASGNSGDAMTYYPAALPGVISVGAVDASGAPAGFSTRGGHVALSAPGVDVGCAGLSGEIVRCSGTSFAAPFVAGAAALMLAAAYRRGVPLSPYTVRDLLVRSARPFAGHTRPTGCGAGILDVDAALTAVDRWSTVFDDEVGPDPSAVVAGCRLPRTNARPTFI